MRALALALASLAALVACADTTYTAEGVDRSCEVVEDCGAVFVGDVCGCGCEMLGVNIEAVAAAQADRAELMESCADILDCAACPDPSLSCEASTCEAL